MNNILLLITTMVFGLAGLQDSLNTTSGKSSQTDSTKMSVKDSIKSETKSVEKKQVVLEYPKVMNNAFSVGEKLTFKVRYGFVRAGTATMEVMPDKEIRGHKVYHIQTKAESASGFSWIYKVEDVVDSYIDKTGMFSWKFDKRLREGSYKADLLVDYFPEDSLADIHFTRYERRDQVRDKEHYQIKTPPFSHDVLAAFYYLRTQKLEVGKVFQLTNHDNKKVYDLEIHIYKREVVETEAGNFSCFLVEPLLKGEGIFQQKGRLLVWMTDDKYKIPVQMTSEVIVGHITTELEAVSGIKGPIPARLEY